ncbi:MAG: hypothetical protein Q9221_007089 [Calogaya cf. arnoldii]
MRSGGRGGKRSLGQTSSARVKAGQSTSGSSSSDSVPGRRVDTSTRTQTDVASILYQMHIIIQPPVESRPGNTLAPPLIISLRRNDTSQTEERLSADINSYWAFVSVVSEDGLSALAPPSTSLLSGTLADLVHEARLTEAEGDVGHIAFQNLALNQPGRFRLRISLLQMPGMQDNPPTGGFVPPGVKNIASVLSHVIHVKHTALAPRIGSHHRNMLRSLRARGLDINEEGET